MLEILSIMEKEFDAQSAGEAKRPLFKLTGKVTEEEYVRLNHHIAFRGPKKEEIQDLPVGPLCVFRAHAGGVHLPLCDGRF